jgi:hypothetical protein
MVARSVPSARLAHGLQHQRRNTKEAIMNLQDDLLAMERKLWSGGKAVYERTLDDDCLIAFTEMAGVSSCDSIAQQADANRWHGLDIEVEGFLQPTDDVALLTYHASAVRGPDEPYEARVSSGYVRRGGHWKMMFHQQTPLSAGKEGA